MMSRNHALQVALLAGMAMVALPLGLNGTSVVSAQEAAASSLHSLAVQCELKTVKLYGAGGIAGLDSYQSGFFFSDSGHILTVWSTVLDVDQVLAVSSDGTRYEATVVGIDTDMCVLKVAMDIFDLNIEPIVLVDCRASTSGLQSHLAGLAVLARNIGADQLRDAGLGQGRLAAPIRMRESE